MSDIDNRPDVMKLLKKHKYLAVFQKTDTNTFELRFDAFDLNIQYAIDKESKNVVVSRQNPDIIISIGPVPEYAYMTTIFMDVVKQMTRYGYAVDLVSLLDIDNKPTTLDKIMELPDDLRDKEVILMNLILLSTDGDVLEYVKEYDVLEGYNFVQCLLGV